MCRVHVCVAQGMWMGKKWRRKQVQVRGRERGVDVSLRHVASHSDYVTEQTPRPLNSCDRKKGKDLRAGREGGGSDLGTGATWQRGAFLVSSWA